LKVSIGAPHGGIFVFALIKTGINNANYDLTGTSIGLGITFALAILLLSSLISAVILGFWRMADIKKGILVLDETNGVKESYDAKIKKLALKENDSHAQKRITKYQAKIEQYRQYEATLQVKNAAYLERKAAKVKVKK
jgi:PTS system fructose-specific IIC component